MRYAIFIWLTILWFAAASAQQVSAPLFYHITEENGLSDNTVTGFFQDSRGVMWMGTAYGLNCYDGSVVTVYRHSDSITASIASDDIHTIKEADGKLWITTGNGLSCMDVRTHRVTTYLVTDKRYAGCNAMKGFVVHGKELIIGTINGLLIFNKDSHIFRYVHNNVPGDINQQNAANSITHLYLDRQNRVWVGTFWGLWRYDPAKSSFICYDDPQNDPAFDGLVNDIIEDHNGTIWFGCWNNGIKKLDVASRTVTNFMNYADGVGCAQALAEQKNSNGTYTIWISKDLTAFDQEKNTFTKYFSGLTSGVTALGIKALYTDHDDRLWIATNKGVHIYDPSRQWFRHIVISSGAPVSSQGTMLYPTANGLLIGGQGTSALRRYSLSLEETHLLSQVVNFQKNGVPHVPAVLDFIPGGRTWWIATTDGLVQYDTITHTSAIYDHRENDDHSLPRNFVNTALVRRNGEVWVFPWRRGAWKLDLASGTFTRVPLTSAPGDATDYTMSNISMAQEDDHGNVWMADVDAAILRYDKQGCMHTIMNQGRISRLDIRGDTLWAVNATNVYRINMLNDSVRAIPLPPDLNKYTYDFASDKQGNLWIATKTGLLAFNKQTHAFRRFDEADGLRSGDMAGSMCMLADGNLVFASETHATLFSPAILRSKPVTASILTGETIVEDHEISADKAEGLSLNYSDKNLTFNWALPHYSDPLHNKYYCYLEGVDEQWRYVGNTGHITYNSLAPGHYTFHYKAASADGEMTPEKSVAIDVHPPFWRTWWFLLIVLVATASIVTWLVRRRIHSIQRQAALQQKMAELEMNALRAQMNPHFIFNALNSIQECVVTNNTTAAYKYLSSFARLVRMILENASKKIISMHEELQMLQLYLELEQLRFDESLQYRLEIDDTVDAALLQIPSMIIQPYVENALWHGLSHKKGEKKLVVHFSATDDQLVCMVEDNGIGRAAAAALNAGYTTRKRSMAMSITKERLDLLSNTSRVETIDLHDGDGHAVGTRVIIYLTLHDEQQGNNNRR